MEDDNLTNLLQRDPFAGETDTSIELPVDALGIPILNDVVEAPPAGKGAPHTPVEPTASSGTEADSAVLAAIRQHLHEQLQEELSELIQGVVPAVIAKATRNLATEMGSELDKLLEQRLEQAITRSIDHHLGKPGE